MDALLSQRARQVHLDGGPSFARQPGVISLAYGMPDPDSFPTRDLLWATRRVLAEQSATALQYGSAQGHAPLLRWIADRLGAQDRAAYAPEQVLITNGSSQGIALVAELLLDPGDTILVEAPTFVGAVRTFNFYGARAVELPLDDEGLRADALERRLVELRSQGIRPRFLYTLPTFHNPTGVTMSLRRRRQIVALAERFELPILEDDPYRDLRFEGRDLPSLQSLDRSGLVIRLGSFSKILAAGFRLGWIVAQPDIVRRLVAMKMEGGTNPYVSHLAAVFALSGRLERHIRRLRRVYRERRDAMLQSLEEHCRPYATWTRPQGGFFVWLTLREQVDPTRLAEASAAEGVFCLPGSACFAAGDGDRHLRLSFSFLPPAQIAEGIARLGRALARATPALASSA